MSDILEQLKMLRTFESDFDKAQAEIRRTAALWLVASMSAIAFVLIESKPGDAGTELALASLILVAWASIAGLFVLWWIDQNTYQRLLETIFTYGLFIEWKTYKGARSSTLAPRSALFAQNMGFSWKLSMFYLMPMVLMILILI